MNPNVMPSSRSKRPEKNTAFFGSPDQKTPEQDPKAVTREAVQATQDKRSLLAVLDGHEYVRREADPTTGKKQEDIPVALVKDSLGNFFTYANVITQGSLQGLLQFPVLAARQFGITNGQGVRDKAVELAVFDAVVDAIDRRGSVSKSEAEKALQQTPGFQDRADVVVAKATHEVVKRKIRSATSFGALKQALEPVEGLRSSSGIYPRASLERALDSSQQAVEAKQFGVAMEMSKSVTNAAGLREAVQALILRAQEREEQARVRNQIPQTRISPAVERSVKKDVQFFGNEKMPVAQRLAEAKTWDDINQAIMNCQGISGSTQHYHPFELGQLVAAARMATTAEARQKALSQITSSEGLRAAVLRALAQ